jgi:hypothetical protein
VATLPVPPDLREPFEAVTRDLRAIFGPRLLALVAFGPRIRVAIRARRGTAPPADTLALVDRLRIDDLVGCAGRAAEWHRAGLRMPLLLARDEFLRSLDAFPLEYDDIIAHHVVLVGEDPLAGIAVRSEDLRRACEARAKGHLVHLREGYLEAGGRAADVASLIVASASPFAALIGNLARLETLVGGQAAGGLAAVAHAMGVPVAEIDRICRLESETTLPPDEASRLFPDYLSLVEKLVAWVDGWSRRA